MHSTGIFRRYRLLPAVVAMAGIAVFFWLSLPEPLFREPLSTVLFDRQGEVVGAHIADDGQWRFPAADSLPEKFSASIRLFEDEYFYRHPGINPLALGRAMVQNFRARRIVSGGSTITMQVIRLSRKGKRRTVAEKLVEMLLSLRLELAFTKADILRMYAANAPFGGNVVGLEAASWRYFGRDPFSLSWAESATLAVLPNAPSLIYPGKNRQKLLEKRNRLLKKLYERHYLDRISYDLSLAEPLPGSPHDLPSLAYHLAERFYSGNPGRRITTSLDGHLQARVNAILELHRQNLYGNQVHNAACLVVSVETGEVLAYAGNIRNDRHPEYGGDVDVITSPRSSGSILKPFLFAEMLYRGEILPNTLIADIPTRYGGYSPKNYNRNYDGAVPASVALCRSLNVPAVRMLYQYGNARFLQDLRELGFSTLRFSPDHYGLSLILGGAEVNLWELAGVYSSMARVLNHFSSYNGTYDEQDWHMPVLEKRTERSAVAHEKRIPGSDQGRSRRRTDLAHFRSIARGEPSFPGKRLGILQRIPRGSLENRHQFRFPRWVGRGDHSAICCGGMDGKCRWRGPSGAHRAQCGSTPPL